MWTFIYTTGTKLKVPEKSISNYHYDNKIELGNAVFYKNFSHRFSNDKVLCMENHRFVAIDGIVLNKKELIGDFQNFSEWCLSQNEYLCKDLRGLFSGVYFNCENEDFYAFGNQTGDEPIFYYNFGEGIIISSDFNSVWEIAKKNSFPISFDDLSANMMLSHGYLYGDNTFVKEIRKVQPGCLIEKINDVPGINIRHYHRFKKKVLEDISQEEAINLVEATFTKAVKRCFDKDLEYGYSHIADISGGLDSRTTNQVALDLGYKNITNICFAKSGSVEYERAQAYSTSVGNDFFFKVLDDLNFFYDIEESIKHTYGLTYYFACTGATRFIRSLNKEYFGIEHGGGIGDSVIGVFHRDSEGKHSFDCTSTVSPIISPKQPDNNYSSEDEEIHYAYYMRFFSYTLVSQMVRRYYDWYSISPFEDIDFMETCLQIPMEMREKHKLYFDWLYAKHPKIFNTSCLTIDVRNYKPPMTFRHLVGKVVGRHRDRIISIVYKFTGKDLELHPINTMNPFDFWYSNDEKLKDFVKKYYVSNIDMLNGFTEIKKELLKLYNEGTCLDKGCVLTVLAAYKQYIN